MQTKNLSELELLIHSFPYRYLGYDFPRLIGSAIAIESEITTILVDFVVMRIHGIRGVSELDHEVFLYQGVPFEVVHASAINSRTLSIFVQEIGSDARGPEVEPSVCRIEEFGLINTLEVFAPRSMKGDIDAIVIDAGKVLRSAYIAIQDAFVTKYLQWRFSVFDTIYALTNTHLRILGDDRLVGRYWFSVTTLKNVRFRYQFDRTAIERAVAWLKEHQGALSSPFYALAFLLVEEANDAVFGAQEFDTRPEQLSEGVIVLPFVRLPHYRVGQVDFWVAERQLYGSDAMACIDVVTLNDLSLQLNCPIGDFDRYGAALAAASHDIRTIFTENKRQYEKDLRAMSSALEALRRNTSLFREITTDVIAKFAAQLVKSG